MSNKKAKERLIKLYGAECFIVKLHLRHDTDRHYTSKGQLKRIKQLTYHHIVMKKDGGKATIENGALLSAENHEWFHRQPLRSQKKMNEKFQENKKCKVEFVDELDTEVEVHYTMVKPSDISISIEKQRRKDKKEFERLRKEYEDR